MLQSLALLFPPVGHGQAKPPVIGPKPPIQVKFPYGVVQPDFLVSPGSAYEISAASLRPDRNFKNQLLLSVGAPAGLYRLTANNDVLSTGTSVALPSIGKTYFWTDNQAIRTEGNQFLIERDSSTFRAFARGRTPSWASEKVTCMGKLETGHRGALSLLTSSDGISWAEKFLIDFGTQFGGKYGNPRPMSDAGAADVTFDLQGKNPDGTKKWWIGGGDRTEMYACPFTGNLYVTTRVISGPFKVGDPQENTTLVLGSSDMGASWSLISTHAAWSPTVMTSTRDGRLWMLQETGTEPTLRVTKPAGRLTLPTGMTSAVVKSANLPAEGPDAVDMEIKIAQPAIARLNGFRGTSSVLLAYQTKNSSGNQEYKILRATINSKEEISSTTVDTVSAEQRSSHSALYGAFVQPELVGESTLRHTNDDALFYWYKARKGASGTYAVQYAIYENGERTQSGFLSTKDGGEREWATRKDPGDYIKGTSYFGADGILRFVPLWVEPDGVHGAVLKKLAK